MIEKEFFADIETHYKSQLPFVAYRKPNEAVIKSILQEDNTIHTVANFTENGFIFSPFDSHNDTILFPLTHSRVISISSLISSETSHISNFKRQKNTSNSLENEQKQHLKLVAKGIQAIHDGRFKKVVLSRVERVPISEENPIKIFKSLLHLYTTAFVYLWYHPEIGLWLGATPETFLNIEGQRFKTMSLAGTQPYYGSIEVDWDEKNSNEQQLVTEFVLESLQPLVNKLKSSKVETIKAGELLHLRSSISGILKFKNLKEVIQTLHPTPAVCGLPKDVTKDFILENENYDREFYTGFLGELNLKTVKTRNTNRRNVENNAYNVVKTTSELFVNLRCMQFKNDDILVYVGGGVTEDSRSELEWEETVNKTKTMMRVLFN